MFKLLDDRLLTTKEKGDMRKCLVSHKNKEMYVVGTRPAYENGLEVPWQKTLAVDSNIFDNFDDAWIEYERGIS